MPILSSFGAGFGWFWVGFGEVLGFLVVTSAEAPSGGDAPMWMSYILPVRGTTLAQELQDRSRTYRVISRMIKNSSWTAVKRALHGFKKVRKGDA